MILPYYHMVSDESVPHVRHLYSYRDVKQFSDDVDFFLKHFKPLDWDTLLACVRNHSPFPEKSFFLSFDDGFREMHDVVAPILKAKGVQAAFFLNSAFVDNQDLCMYQKISLLADRIQRGITPAQETEIYQELRATTNHEPRTTNHEPLPELIKSIKYAQKAVLDRIAETIGLDWHEYLKTAKPYLTTIQIQKMIKDGFVFGGHSHDHPLYRDISLENQLNQTLVSVNLVVKQFKLNYRAFAFPHTNNGVSNEFFQRVFQDGTVEVSFGTGGMLEGNFPGHFQRFSMEKQSAATTRSVSYYYGQAAYHRRLRR